jgi:Cytoskeletal-regulatory complex EF hand
MQIHATQLRRWLPELLITSAIIMEKRTFQAHTPRAGCIKDPLMHVDMRCAADGDGRLTGGDAVEFFKRSGLPRDQLAKAWAMADSSRRGFLDQHSFALVRLVHIHLQTDQSKLRASAYEQLH